MIKTKVAFLEGRLLSSQSEKFQKGLISYKKTKKPLLFWSCKQVNKPLAGAGLHVVCLHDQN